MIDDYLLYTMVVGVAVHPENTSMKNFFLYNSLKLTPTAKSVNDIDILRLSCKSLEKNNFNI